MRKIGAHLALGELQLGDPDRILVAHAHRHQPRDFTEHRGIDAGPADELPQPVYIKPRVFGALILRQPADAFADIGRDGLGRLSGSDGGVPASSPMKSASK